MNREDIVTRYSINLSKISVTLPLEKNGRYYKAVLSKSDVEYLYSELNLSVSEIIELTGITQPLFYRLLNKYDLKQTKERRFENARNRYKETCLKHFGTDNPNELKEIRDKIKRTKFEKYGDENYSNREKAKETSLKRYGSENWLNSQSGKKRKIDWCIETYGVDNVSKVPEIQQKKKETSRCLYGSDFYMQTEQFKKRNKKCWDSKSKDEIKRINELRKRTLLERTGYESACENPETIEKRKETNFQKYGVSNWAKTEAHKEKNTKTRIL